MSIRSDSIFKHRFKREDEDLRLDASRGVTMSEV